MYRHIASKPSIRMAYLAYDNANPAPGGDRPITVEETDAIAAAKRQALEAELEIATKAQTPPRPSTFAGAWARIKGGPDAGGARRADRGQRRARSARSRARCRCCPADFNVHPKLKAFVIEGRAAMGAGEKPIDWGMGEALAFGTLVAQGGRVRLSGQDSRRGTFSHRHATLFDYNDGHEYTPLQHVREKQGTFEVRDSPLSEGAVLGFDYGYSLDMPEGLTIWEAQFGDFVERGAGDHRSVRVVVRGQVAPGERPGAAAAARHGRAGPRALERAPRSLPQPVRERQHAGRAT